MGNYPFVGAELAISSAIEVVELPSTITYAQFINHIWLTTGEGASLKGCIRTINENKNG